MYLSLKAVKWFTIGSRWKETFHKWWTTALPSITDIRCFSSFYLWIIKLLYLFLHLLIQIWSQNHNCNALNVFLSFLAIVMRGQRTVKEQSEKGQIILWPFSQSGPLGKKPFLELKNHYFQMNKKKWFIKLIYFVHIKTIWVLP